ncbi:MAG: L,D-transpeptidase, partial [Pseudomonadota bacterium]
MFGFFIAASLVAAGLGLGWMVYLTRLPDNPNPTQAPVATPAPPAALAAASAAPTTAAAAKPAPAQVATASQQPAPSTTLAPPEPSTSSTTLSVTTSTSTTTLTTAPPRAQVAAPPQAQPAAAAADQPHGNSLIFCYQGKAPDTRLFLVDKSRQRVMVLRYLGEMTLDYEFPCSTGAQPGNKQAAGDERTPEGIYFTTHRFEDRKITIFGDRAIHLNYPNPFDQVDQRQGNGIFIHGTNQRLRPRASNGCVVLQNEDLTILASTIQEQLTPVVVTDHLRLPDLDQRNQACQMLAGISVADLDKAEAALGHRLAIQPAPGRVPQPKEMQELEEMGLRLAGLNGKSAQVKAETQGMALYGIGEKWVVVVSQRISGPTAEPMQVTRRFYLRGKDPRHAELLLGQWVVENTPQARLLASWAPPPPPPAAPAAPAAPKPVEVAT